MKKKCASHLTLVLVALVGVAGCVSPVNDQNPALKDVPALIEGLPTAYCPTLVKGTYSTHLFTTYSAGIDHVQGVTRIGDTYIIAQGARLGRTCTLLVAGDGKGTCSFHRVGKKFPHCGGIQSCGNIVVVPVEPWLDVVRGPVGPDTRPQKASEVLFIDFSDPRQPIELTVKIARSDKCAGAAGVAYHAAHKCHYVVVYHAVHNDGYVDLYKSNGLPLTDSACAFTHVASMKSDGNAAGGGTNLLYEDTGRLYMAGLDRDKDGREKVTLSEIKNPGKDATIERTLVKTLSKSGGRDNYAAGFRWGGGIVVKSSTDIDILAVSRTLCYGTAHINNHAKVKRWTNDNWVRLLHEGAYVAKFYLSWREAGEPKGWKSGKRAVGFETVIYLPRDVQNVFLNAQAMTGLLGRRAWKRIIDRNIVPQRTYRVSGTTLSPKCHAEPREPAN